MLVKALRLSRTFIARMDAPHKTVNVGVYFSSLCDPRGFWTTARLTGNGAVKDGGSHAEKAATSARSSPFNLPQKGTSSTFAYKGIMGLDSQVFNELKTCTPRLRVLKFLGWRQ